MPRKDLTVAEWKEELSRGLEFRRQYGGEEEWAELERLFYNMSDVQQKGSSPNVIFSTGDALLSTLGVPFPYLTATPTRMSEVDTAPVVESEYNRLVKQLKIPQENEVLMLSAYLWGRGIAKIGYDSEWGWTPEFDIYDRANPIGISPTQLDRDGNRIEFNNYSPGNPWYKPVLPHDFVVPWGTRTLDEAPWCAHRVVRHIDDVKSDPKYSGKKNLQANLSMEDFVRSYQSPIQPYRSGDEVQRTVTANTRKTEYVELWEIHDRRTMKILVIATGHDKFLRNDDDLLAVHGLPFVSLGFIPQSRHFWTTSDASYLRWHQAELTDIANQTTKQRRISIMKFLYQQGAISREQLAKLASNVVGAGVEVNQGFELDKVIKTIQPSQNPQVYNEAEETRRNARETVGFSRNQFGEFEQTGRRTAREVQSVQENSELRMSRRQVQVRDLYIETFRKIGGILKTFWKAPRIAQILDQNAVPAWVQFDGAVFDGDYMFDVGFSAESGETRSSRSQQALALYPQLLQDPAVDPVQARRYLVRAFNDPRLASVYKPGILEGDPRAAVQLQMQQQEMQSSSGGVSQGGGQGSRPQLPSMPGGGT